MDALVNAALSQKGVLGSRMTGAGTGGCAIALVNKEKVNTVIQNVQEIYMAEIGYEASFYIAKVGNGAKALN